MMMLSACYIALRFVHFTALMVLFGCTVYSVLLAPRRLATALVRYLWLGWRSAVWLSFSSACLLLCAQAGLMGDGWSDTVNPAIWQAVLSTQFGAVWMWQLLLALAAVVVLAIKSRRLQALLLVLTFAQLVLLAGIGHATMHEGVTRALQSINHAIHLVSAAFWVGGLLPLWICMGLARKTDWRDAAISTMMRFSRYGHVAVAAVIITGIVNGLLIVGWKIPPDSRYVSLLFFKTALVGVMVVLALLNRYWLVPQFTHSTLAQQRFIQLIWLEVILSAAVLLLVSLFATLEPF